MGDYVARPKSEDKRNAILDAARTLCPNVVSRLPPRRQISRRAMFAEGTLSRISRLKNDLINSLYREIKLETR